MNVHSGCVGIVQSLSRVLFNLFACLASVLRGCGRYVSQDEPREEMVQRLVKSCLFVSVPLDSALVAFSALRCFKDPSGTCLPAITSPCICQAWEIAGCPALLDKPFKAAVVTKFSRLRYHVLRFANVCNIQIS